MPILNPETSEMIKAFRYRIYPTDEQKDFIMRNIGACRFVYNEMLSRQRKIYKRRGEHMSSFDMKHCVTLMKKHVSWLNDFDSKSLRYECVHLDEAYKKFFRKKGGFPKFKSRKCDEPGYTTDGRIHVNERYVQLPIVGPIRAKVT